MNKKRVIRLTESDIRRIVRESVKDEFLSSLSQPDDDVAAETLSLARSAYDSLCRLNRFAADNDMYELARDSAALAKYAGDLVGRIEASM